MTPALISKRQNGRYYTEGNPFILKPFCDWAHSINLKDRTILEPFAGANNIIKALRASGYAKSFASFDIAPANSKVKFLDTIKNFPKEFDVCITNPPWLAKNSAHRRGLDYSSSIYDDLYKHSLDLCLQNCTYVAALIPATFLQSGLFVDRLESIVFLHDQNMFLDTDNPVCLALFKGKSKDVKIFFDSKFVGNLSEFSKLLPKVKSTKLNLVFNDPNGELGFIAFDNTHGPSIRFCNGRDLQKYNIGFSSRMITRIGGDFNHVHKLVNVLNVKLTNFRLATKDVFLTPFKGLRKDGVYRRRMDYGLARDFISFYA